MECTTTHGNAALRIAEQWQSVQVRRVWFVVVNAPYDQMRGRIYSVRCFLLTSRCRYKHVHLGSSRRSICKMLLVFLLLCPVSVWSSSVCLCVRLFSHVHFSWLANCGSYGPLFPFPLRFLPPKCSSHTRTPTPRP
jgi:hypothetical protein